MLEVLASSDHVVALRVSGTMTGSDFDQVIETVEAVLGRDRRRHRCWSSSAAEALAETVGAGQGSGRSRPILAPPLAAGLIG